MKSLNVYFADANNQFWEGLRVNLENTSGQTVLGNTANGYMVLWLQIST